MKAWFDGTQRLFRSTSRLTVVNSVNKSIKISNLKQKQLKEVLVSPSYFEMKCLVDIFPPYAGILMLGTYIL